MKRVLIVTEADEKVASGHLMECLDIADILENNEYDVKFAINEDMPQKFKDNINRNYYEYTKGIETCGEFIDNSVSSYGVNLIIFNFRCIENELLQKIREIFKGKIVCIDELGHRNLECDVIINPMIDSYYWEYGECKAKIYSGAKYLALSPELMEYHKKKKIIHKNLERICVSMGGVDPFGTTLKLSEWVPKILPDTRIDIVIGGGFQYEDELSRIIYDKKNITLHKNIDYIYNLFYESDIAFCAGGNTLHELACIGTPTLVIPSMPHEIRNGKYFEKHGFGVCLPITHELDFNSVKTIINDCKNMYLRNSFMMAGKTLIKGDGLYNSFVIINSVV